MTTSNGTGLGHLTRSMAIARRLGPELEPLFVTLSAAAPVVRELGFAVEYLASYATPGAGNDYRWSRRLRARLRALIAECEPAVVVFDGTHPYEALLGAMPADAAKVWCRRPLWRVGSSRVPLGRAGFFDAVLEPGELAETEDRGPTVALRERAHRVGPIVMLDREELLDRDRAQAELGFEPGALNLLVTLGQGAEVRDATARCLRHLAGRDGVRVAALSSAIGAVDELPAGVVGLRATYPMSRYFRAFDAAVAAAGYNAYHELIALGVPALFVPMRRETDDQPARARHAESAGIGLGLDGPADPRLEAQLDRLLDPAERDRLNANLAAIPPARGAADAAAWLAALAHTGRAHTDPADGPETSRNGTKRATRRVGQGETDAAAAYRRRWGQFLASLPRTLLRLGRQQLTQPRVRALVLAIGIPEGDLPDAVRAGIEEAGEARARTLVVTDSLAALRELRALGIGVEHVPARDERQHQLAGGSYEDFLRGRLELIRAERPTPRRIVVAPGGAPLP